MKVSDGVDVGVDHSAISSGGKVLVCNPAEGMLALDQTEALGHPARIG